jgi:DNA-binding NtrC family response regulator
VRKVLVIDDDRSVRHLIQKGLSSAGYEVVTAETGEEGIQCMLDSPPDVALLDIFLPESNGLELFRKLHSLDRKLPVIFITGDTSSSTAIEAMRIGAFDYVAKPINLEQIENLVSSAIASRQLMEEPVALSIGEASETGEQFIGRGPAMLQVFKAIGRVAAQDVTILVRGESGSGKELVARALFEHSDRREMPYVAVNCAALPDQLLESELFGHEKGAFTGADRRREGKFKQCDGGTIFMDEIGDMSPMVQAKVLRLIQEQMFERVGGNESIKTNVRIIAATNRNLEQMVIDGTFREDLLYRLNGFTINLPPLRHRREDIVPLLEYFLRRARSDMRKHDLNGIAPSALELLLAYDWPGNVRQLQSVVRQAVLNTTGTVMGPDALPSFIRTGEPLTGATDAPTLRVDSEGPVLLPSPALAVTDSGEASLARDKKSWIESRSDEAFSLGEFIDQRMRSGTDNLYAEALEELERSLFARVLAATGGNQSKTAQILGITRGKVRDRIAAFEIQMDRTVKIGK